MAKYCLFGASHVTRWSDDIRRGTHIALPDVYMWGQAGLATFSKALKNNIASHHKSGREIWLLVPDFRFGNNFFKDHENFNKAELFIDGYSHFDRTLLTTQRDKILYEWGLEILDYYTNEYKTKLKLIFYDLFVREYRNRTSNKYIIEGKYQHPIWNYTDLVDRYKKHTIDISIASKNFDSYLVDQQGHPSPKCMAFIYNAFLTGDAQAAFISAENAYEYFQASQFKTLFDKEQDRKILFDIGVFLMKQGRYDLASLEFHKLLSLEPFNESALVQLGVCKKRLGLIAEAKLAFNYAVTINANNSGALIELAKLLFENSEIALAKKTFMQLLENKPNHYEALLYIARIYYIEKDIEASLNIVKKLLVIDNTNKSVLELHDRLTAL